MNYGYTTSGWAWEVFGDQGKDARGLVVKSSLIYVVLPWEVPLWRRIITRIFLGSKWTRLPATAERHSGQNTEGE